MLGEHVSPFVLHLCVIDQESLQQAGCTLASGVHAACHLLIACFPWIVACETDALSCEHVSQFRERSRPPRILIYDTKRGLTGLIAAAFPRFAELLDVARAVIHNCPCTSGCPRCVHNALCSEHNTAIDKKAAGMILDFIVEKHQRLKAKTEATD
eukprot:m.133345 g.133345  ORF g.133345 m.133345 type:complete len:155 (-) comp52406_c1_seq2:1580-2044(-)